MTYHDLWHRLLELSNEQLECDVTVLVLGEFYPVLSFQTMTAENKNADVLDEGHPYLEVCR